MALLTADDVREKEFSKTKYREGFDQDEVDDFLDEIVVELRRLNQENDELRKKLAEAGSGTAGLAAISFVASAVNGRSTPDESLRPAWPLLLTMLVMLNDIDKLLSAI